MRSEQLKKAYIHWLEWKPTTFRLRNRQREALIQKAYLASHKTGKVILDSFLQWLKENDHKIDTVVLWGSYIKGTESEHSFTRFKIGEEKQDLIAYGPSDIDALVIMGDHLESPKLLREYQLFNQRFDIVSRVKLNVFKDVVLLTKPNLIQQLERTKPDYRDYYFVSSYFYQGLVLKTSQQTRHIFSLFNRSGILEESEEYFNERFTWFKEFIGV